jgi:hypothetical protein
VLQLPARAASLSTVASPLLSTAKVVDVRVNPAVEGGSLLTLEAPRSAAYAITAASDSGSISLVQIGGGS